MTDKEFDFRMNLENILVLRMGITLIWMASLGLIGFLSALIVK